MIKYRFTFLGRIIVFLICLIVFLMISMIICFYNYRTEIDALSKKHEDVMQKFIAKEPTVNKVVKVFSQKEQKKSNKNTSQILTNTELLNFKLSIYFEPDTLTIKREYINELNSFLKIIKNIKEAKIIIEGNCATLYPNEKNINSSKVNYKISMDRAKNVAEYFKENAIESDRLILIGNGSTKPYGDNECETGRALNRRVDISLKKKINNPNSKQN